MSRLINQKQQGVLLITAIFTVLSGCTVYHLPNPDPIAMQEAPVITAESVTVINGQRDGTTVEIGKAGAGTMMGDLKSWTASAVGLLEGALESHGVAVRNDGDKQLELSIVEAQLGVSGLQYAGIPKCSVRLLVRTGGGQSSTFFSEQNALAPPSACDKAIGAAVTAIFSDLILVDYLNR